MVIIRGIRRLTFVSKIFHNFTNQISKVYVFEGSHETIDFTDEKTYEKYINFKPLKKLFMALKNDDDKEFENNLDDFEKLSLKDLCISINVDNYRTMPMGKFDFSQQAFDVMTKKWGAIADKEPPMKLIAVGIICMLFGGLITAIPLMFFWLLVEILKVLVNVIH
jgi:hypothetical protein